MEELGNMEGGVEQPKRGKNNEGEVATTLEHQSSALPSTEFVKVEKNLASLGFFTPSSKRLRNAQEKSFTMTTMADGQRLEVKGTIIPSAKYGLPITADQDKWIALCKILTDILRKEGEVSNPIAFTSADILRLLHKHRHSGKNYREIEEWLDVLFSTTIFSEGVVYLANEKRRVKDRFRVFERAVSFGKELPDGTRADKNYVWFSEWQLQNINANHLLPIDLEAYRALKNHISKALVPLLQVWLYATREEGVFEKRYDELCQILNIQRYRYPSLIKRTLGPSLDELKEFGYLEGWQLEETSDGDNYKIVFHHGEKFHRDRRARLRRKQTSTAGEQHHEASSHQPIPASPGRQASQDRRHANVARSVNEEWLAALIRRGVTETRARTILASVSADHRLMDQLEWGDLQIEQSGGRIANPAGFYISLVSENVIPPPTFETRAKRAAREEEERRQEEERRAQQELETEYQWYCEREIERYMNGLDAAEVGNLLAAKRQENREKYQSLSSEIIEQFAQQDTKRELGKRAPLMTIEEFKSHHGETTDSILKPVVEPQILETSTVEPPPPVVSEVATALGGLPESATPDTRSGVGENETLESAVTTHATPAIAEPVIESASYPPAEERGDDAIDRASA